MTPSSQNTEPACAPSEYSRTCVPAIVLHPERDRTHFHLVYGTRHRKGVEVFKDAEKKAMATQETARAAAQERRRQQSTGMASLFGDIAPGLGPLNRLRRHYIDRSSSLVRRDPGAEVARSVRGDLGRRNGGADDLGE